MKKHIWASTLALLCVTLLEATSVTISTPTINLGETTTLKAIGYKTDDSFLWKGGMGYQEVFSDENIFNFQPHISGKHTIELLVNGKSEHNITVEVTPTSEEVNIEAGNDQTICLGEYAELHATAPANTILEWKIGNDTYANGSVFYFNPHDSGVYSVDLLGNNKEDSLLVTVKKCDDENHKPIANAGEDENRLEMFAFNIELNGEQSKDEDDDILTYTWSIISQPIGSTASISDSNYVTPFFDVDKKGIYIVQLIVNDGKIDSSPDTVKISIIE